MYYLHNVNVSESVADPGGGRIGRGPPPPFFGRFLFYWPIFFIFGRGIEEFGFPAPPFHRSWIRLWESPAQRRFFRAGDSPFIFTPEKCVGVPPSPAQRLFQGWRGIAALPPPPPPPPQNKNHASATENPQSINAREWI